MLAASPAKPPPKPPPVSATIHRSRPVRTSIASHAGLTELSAPEKPPIPATFVSPATIAAAALLWLSTPTVPPP